MGLKGYRLWVMGQLDSNVQSPTAAVAEAHEVQHEVLRVAVQVGILLAVRLVQLVPRLGAVATVCPSLFKL
jgi:hypothetical protein